MKKKFLLCIALTMVFTLHSQTTFYKNEVVNWEELKSVSIPKNLGEIGKEQLLIIDDNCEWLFFKNNHRLLRLVTFYIADEKGLDEIKKIKLPESFDIAYDAHMRKQGRFSRIKIPLTNSYSIKKFAARKYANSKWAPLTIKDRYEKVRWLKATGEFGDEDQTVFEIQNIQVGDVVQVFYESTFEGMYGGNLFYFYSNYPKLKCEKTFTYPVSEAFSEYDFLLPLNIPDSCKTRKRVYNGKELVVTDKIVLKNVPAINYPSNAFEGATLPHIYLDLGGKMVIKESYPDGASRNYTYGWLRPKRFEWLFLIDTVNNYTRIYDKNSATLRKFIRPIINAMPDTSAPKFFKALSDTLNNFQYYTMNHLLYNQSNIYDLSNADHLAKRRLVGAPYKVCSDILNEKKIFYYIANIQDKRYASHDPFYRAHFPYEWEIFAIPDKNSFVYYMPRFSGVKYHLNELPFYLEGTLASLTPKNFQKGDTAKDSKFFKFIKTHKGTYNENTRTENASVKVDLPSKKAELTIKESLSGQFSTVLRHLYLNEYIDSTISPHYFRKCTEKPKATEVKLKLSSKITEFPFRYSFNCSENISLDNSHQLSLRNWFSFTLNSQNIPTIPTHDYYFDFDYSDAYNFMIDFGNPVTIKNAEAFKRTISNDYFELESEIVKSSDSTYLIKVKFQVKQIGIRLKDMQLLMDIIKELESINNFVVEV